MGGGEAILDHVDGAVVCLEARTLRLLHASASARALAGEAVGDGDETSEGWRRLFDPEDWPRVVGLCHAVSEDGHRRSTRHLVRDGAGRPRAFRTSVSRMSEEPRRLLVHMLDLTEEDDERITGEGALRELLREAPLATFCLDRDGVVRLAEGKGLEKLGVDPRTIVGRSMSEGTWPYHWMVDHARRALRGEAFSAIVNADGSWLSVRYVPRRDANGGVESVLGFATDITECKRVFDLIGTIDAVLWQVAGADLRLAFMGGSAEKLLGEQPEPWLGRTDFFERHLVEDERADVLQAIGAVAAAGVERTILHRIRRGDGTERWCRTTLRAVAGPGSGASDVVGLMLDVTERKTIEKAFLPLDRRWQIVAEQAPVIVYTLDRALCFTSGIGAGLTALGLSPTGTLIGLPLEQYLHAPSAAPLLDAHRTALGGTTVRTRARWRRRTYDLRLEPLRGPGDGDAIMGVIGVAVDVTEQDKRERHRERLLEAERVAHAEADEAVQVRDQLFGIASHELRTPLAGLLLTLQAVRASAPSEPAARRLQLAEKQALRLNGMIEELLDASRLSAGRRLELERETVDLALLAQQIVARFEPELDAAKTSIAVRAPVPVLGSWDRSRLDQVVTNMLSNAIKYGRGRPIEVCVELAGPELTRLSVRDCGIGIASQDLRLLFHPFRRLHGADYRGFGLGLFIVAEIVRAHGGHIGVESELDKGTQFTVELPTGTT